MRLLRRTLCFALAGIILLAAGCSGVSGAEKDRKSEGRYVESDITPPLSGRFTSFLSADGVIVCFDEGLITRYESADGGETWSETPGPGRNTDRYRAIQDSTMLQDGSLLVYIQGEGLLSLAPDGSSSPYAIDIIDQAIADGSSLIIYLLEALEKDRLALGYMIGGMVTSVMGGRPIGGGVPPDGEQRTGAPGDVSGPVTQPGPGSQQSTRSGSDARTSGGTIMQTRQITVLCELSTGRVITELPVESATAAVSGDTVVYLMDNANRVTMYNLSDGKPAGKADIKFSGSQDSNNPVPVGLRMGSGGSVLALGRSGSLLAALDGSLLLAASDGVVETVLESTVYSIGTPRSSVDTVFTLSDDSIVVSMLIGMQTNTLYKYVWDENAAVNPDKILTVWSLEDNGFMRAAIAELRKKHPDSYITYEVALDGKSAISASDAVKNLNVSLLNGNGPDIILLDGCSVESYADRGMLLDISGLADTSGVYGSLLEPFITDGNLYCLPAQFLAPMLMGSPEYLAKVQSLDDIVSLVTGGNDLPAGGTRGGGAFGGLEEDQRAALYFADLKELCDILWISSAPEIVKDNRLDTDALYNYLSSVKAISDKYLLMDETTAGPGMGVGFSDGGTATILQVSLVWYTMQFTHFAAFSAGNLQLLQMMMDRDGSSLRLFPGLTYGAWQPSTVTGISADTKVPDFAAELVNVMLSTDVQRLNYGTGLPVTRAGLAAQIKAINEQRQQFNLGEFSFDAEALIGELKYPSMEDTVLTGMMWRSIERCCKGEISVEGAVKEIEQNIKNYLAERA